jgi:hypothetical protein
VLVRRAGRPAFERSAFVICTIVLAIADVPPPAGGASDDTSVGLAGVAQADARTSRQTIGAGLKDRDMPRLGASNAPRADGVIHTENRFTADDPFPA